MKKKQKFGGKNVNFSFNLYSMIIYIILHCTFKNPTNQMITYCNQLLLIQKFKSFI